MNVDSLSEEERFELRTALEAHMAALTAQMDRLMKAGTRDQQSHVARRMGRTHMLLESISG